MKRNVHLWQLFFVLGLAMLLIKLALELLVPIGIALLVLGVIMMLTDKMDDPKVMKVKPAKKK